MSDLKSSFTQAVDERNQRTKIAKTIGLGLVSLGLIILTWWLVNMGLYGGQPMIFWIWPLLTMMLWIATTCFFILVRPNHWLMLGVNTIALISYLYILPKDWYVLAGGILFFLLNILFERRIRSEEKNQQHFSIRRTISSSLLVATYAFLILLGFNIYYNTSQDFKNNPDQFYDRIGESVAKSVPFVSETLSGNVNLNQSLDDYLTSQADSEELDELPPDEREDAIAEFRRQFLQRFGINATGTEPLAEVISRIINEKSTELLGPYERFFPLIFTLIVLALLRTFAFVFNWLTIFVTWVLFKLLVAVKFFKIEKAQVEVDKLEV